MCGIYGVINRKVRRRQLRRNSTVDNLIILI